MTAAATPSTAACLADRRPQRRIRDEREEKSAMLKNEPPFFIPKRVIGIVGFHLIKQKKAFSRGFLLSSSTD